MTQSVLLLDFSEIPLDVMEKVEEAISEELEMEVDARGARVPHTKKLKGKQNAKDLIKILTGMKGIYNYVVGLTEEELAAPGIDFQFGIASQPQEAAIVSLAELKTGDTEKYAQRAAKEVVHELGHLLNLSHCDNEKCVMNFSESPEEVDRKGIKFCSQCQKKLP